MAGCSDCTNCTVPGSSATASTTPPDLVAPTVMSTTPACGVTGVPVDIRAITATFHKAMDPASITGTSFTVTGPGITPITGAVSYTAASNTAQFTPTGPLPANT